MNNLYTYVDHNQLSINNLAQVLPENWKNVQGLNLFSDEKLQDLSWAGHPGYGWVKLSSFDLSSYTSLPEWIELSKNNAKNLISKARFKSETELLNWNGNLIEIDEKTKVALSFKLLSVQSNPNQTFLWKFENKEVEITSAELLDLSSSIDQYIQKCFDLEFQKKLEIDQCNTAYDLGQIDLEINWPKTEI